MSNWLRALFAERPTWMNVLMVFCGYMAFVYVPWDFFIKPTAEDEEVWFGWPWAAVYVGQVAFGMLVWGLLYGPGGFGGLVIAVTAFLAFGALARALWQAKPLFEGGGAPLSQRYGGWAVITGASAGLGEAFARALAREGIPCVLSARREDRLKQLAEELATAHGIETRVLAADLTDPAAVDRLADAVADLDVGILVNNAGFGYAGRFSKLAEDRLRDLVQVNCAAPVVLTHRLLPKLIERGRGAILFTGSVAGRVPLPLHSVYAASKAFDLFVGEALAVELADENIDVLVLEPGSTATEFQTVAGEVAHVGEPAADVVAVARAALGRQPTLVSGWKSWFRATVLPRVLPRSLLAHAARDVIEAQTPTEMR